MFFFFLTNRLVFFFETRIKILGFACRVDLSQDSGLWIIFQWWFFSICTESRVALFDGMQNRFLRMSHLQETTKLFKGTVLVVVNLLPRIFRPFGKRLVSMTDSVVLGIFSPQDSALKQCRAVIIFFIFPVSTGD